MAATQAPPDAADPEGDEKSFCALVALSHDGQPLVRDLIEKISDLFPKLPPAQDAIEDETGMGFALCGAIVAIVRMPGPIPIDPDHTPAIRKPLSAAALDAQQAYFVIAVKGCDPLRGAIVATEVAAAIVECCTYAIAVYWPGARLWIAPREFADQAVMHVHSRPLTDLWVDCRVWSVEGKGHAGYTRGLKVLGYRDFEVLSSPESAKDLHDRLTGLSDYILINGPIIEDGHTVGHDEKERISVLLCRSVHGLQETVMRLHYDDDFRPRRPWWKLI